MDWAIEMPIGASSAAAAVLDMNCVRPQDSRNIAMTMMSGEALLPMMPTTPLAIIAPAPVLSIASASGSMPANRKMVVQSMPPYACFSVRQPVMTQARAPMMAAVCIGTLMVFESAMAMTTSSRMMAQMVILRVSFGRSDVRSLRLLSTWPCGQSRRPIVSM